MGWLTFLRWTVCVCALLLSVAVVSLMSENNTLRQQLNTCNQNV